MHLINTLVAFAAALGTLIVAHEFGHYLVARTVRREGAALLRRLRPPADHPPAGPGPDRVGAGRRSRSAAT